ncbi:phospholipase A2 inhibitor 25 kDa subunit-like [Chiloscyllium plagiosum]|uniref:phospholipase A2 inhibitor 25 kDa subunit-like n=1 Tax=Chiloscyllium plagiosum TaxID=36176 RepID=UPI001CB86126|nr:phospholipase A2 inhibitor 25 kDa subunit-like [Chiloscyllium plagiosum]
MQLLPSVLIICAFVSEVQPLTCHSCTAQGKTCETTQTSCPPGINSCITMSVSTNAGGIKQIMIFKNCGVCERNISLQFGLINVAQICKSCSSNLCNDHPFEEEPSNLNGLECYSNSPEGSNAMSIVKCTGTQDRCLTASGNFGGVKMELRGCASSEACQAIDQSTMGMQLSYTGNCCEPKLCNKAVLFPGSGISLSTLADWISLFQSPVPRFPEPGNDSKSEYI